MLHDISGKLAAINPGRCGENSSKILLTRSYCRSTSGSIILGTISGFGRYHSTSAGRKRRLRTRVVGLSALLPEKVPRRTAPVRRRSPNLGERGAFSIGFRTTSIPYQDRLPHSHDSIGQVHRLDQWEHTERRPISPCRREEYRWSLAVRNVVSKATE